MGQHHEDAEATAATDSRPGGVRRTRRRALLGLTTLLVTALTVCSATLTTAGAQDATPAPLGFELAPGVTSDYIDTGGPTTFRIQIAAGVTWDEVVDPSDPSIVLVYQEAGTLTWTVQAPITVFRAGATDQPGEAVEAGIAFDTSPGDYLAAPPMVPAVVANEGDTPASFIGVGLMPPQSGAATPTS